ncbi:hypothetical protein ACF1BU_34070 [Streptomyces sp. NPDC014724]|uniref:hypothetical protein n=1 Tax=unclassified Streptomyces TaxID=2593676 RepID=UPI0036F5A893
MTEEEAIKMIWDQLKEDLDHIDDVTPVDPSLTFKALRLDDLYTEELAYRIEEKHSLPVPVFTPEMSIRDAARALVENLG